MTYVKMVQPTDPGRAIELVLPETPRTGERVELPKGQTFEVLQVTWVSGSAKVAGGRDHVRLDVRDVSA